MEETDKWRREGRKRKRERGGEEMIDVERGEEMVDLIEKKGRREVDGEQQRA